MPTAIVTGATGILGREIVAALARDNRWTKVHALSRSQKESYPPLVQHDHIDLLESAEGIAKQLEVQNVEAEYLFFAAYLAKDDEETASEVNGAMLQNFLSALRINGVKLKRVLLTTGAKQVLSCLDCLIDGPGRPPNFYYTQQRILQNAARRDEFDWVVTYPNDVIGIAQQNFMCLSISLGLYAAITAELTGELEFPGSETFYNCFDCFTDSRLHADFNLWAALEPKCSNQAFNVVNGDVESWANMWPKLAAHFGSKVPAHQFDRATPDASRTSLAEIPPYEDLAAERGMLGRVLTGFEEQRINLVKWSRKEEVRKCWKQLAGRYGLEQDAFDKATWGFLGFVLGRNYNIVISANKARSFGWTGYKDTWESFTETFDQLELEKILPPRRK